MKYVTPNIFDIFFRPVWYVDYPDSEISKTDTGYKIALDMPGFDKSQIVVEPSGNYLNVSAKSDTRSYTRRIAISGTDPDNIKAQYKHGVLTLELPSRKSVSEKRISVE